MSYTTDTKLMVTTMDRDWLEIRAIMERLPFHKVPSGHLKHRLLVDHHNLSRLLDTPLKVYRTAWRLGVHPIKIERFIETSPLKLNVFRLPHWAEETLVLNQLSPESLAYFLSDLQRDPNDRTKIVDKGGSMRDELMAKCSRWDRPYHMYGTTGTLYGHVEFIEVLRQDQGVADKVFIDEIQTGWFQVRVMDELPATYLC